MYKSVLCIVYWNVSATTEAQETDLINKAIHSPIQQANS